MLSAIVGSHELRPIIIGYSSGAVTAAALLAQHAEFVEGAVLLRPESPYGASTFPWLDNRPVLVISGCDDVRRKINDAPDLVNLLRAAGAHAEWHDLDCGHTFDPDGRDIELTRARLSKRG
jgi:phospholipase/carboxylesterase